MPERRSVSTCVLLLLSFSSAAYGQKLISVLRGELQSDSPAAVHMNEYQVEIVSGSDLLGSERSSVLPDGSFFLHNLTPGTSHLRVLDSRGEPLAEQYVTVQEGVMVSVRLPASPASRPATGTISARELTHPKPPKAIKEYLSAKKAAAAGDFDKSVEHFERAVQIHPGFLEAWNDLGVIYTKQKRFSEAIEVFRKASALDPASGMIAQNLRVAQYWAAKTVLK